MKLIIGNTYFVETKKELTESMFNPAGSASGYYRVNPDKGILFSTPAGLPFAFLVANRHGERFFVNCSRHTIDGKSRLVYQFGLGELERLRLSLPESVMAEYAIATGLWKETGEALSPA